MAVTFFSSEDAGAPQLETTRNVSGNYQNSIIDVMDAILLTGYGSKPGLGWTKEMTSEVPDSNRTVYKNKSAHADDMFLLVESNKDAATSLKFQIADLVSSPESYSGYSHVAITYQVHTGQQFWFAIGDERTLIFITCSWYVFNHSKGGNYTPMSLYIGDFETPDASNPKGWGLLCQSLKPGTLDSTIPTSDYGGTFGINKSNYNTSKWGRPVTQVPGEAWSENSTYTFTSTFDPLPSSSLTGLTSHQSIADFEANVLFRAPWFFVMGLTNFYRLRGVYTFYPWLMTAGSTRNFMKTAMVDGIEYMPLPQASNQSSNLPLTVYIQTTGDW